MRSVGGVTDSVLIGVKRFESVLVGLTRRGAGDGEACGERRRDFEGSIRGVFRYGVNS